MVDQPCTHRHLSMNKCVDCGQEVFSLPPFPGELPGTGVTFLNARTLMLEAKALADILVKTIGEFRDRLGSPLPVTLVIAALRLVRNYAVSNHKLTTDEAIHIERALDALTKVGGAH